MKAMEETEAGRARLANHSDRLDRTMAEQLEWQVIRPAAAEPAAAPTAKASFLARRAHDGADEPQPGRSGTGDESGVPFSISGQEPAERAPTPTEERDGARGSRKSQGPSGLIGADRDTAATARQNAEDNSAPRGVGPRYDSNGYELANWYKEELEQEAREAGKLARWKSKASLRQWRPTS